MGDVVAQWGDVAAQWGDVVAQWGGCGGSVRDVVAQWRDVVAQCWGMWWFRAPDHRCKGPGVEYRHLPRLGLFAMS
jgi:hypothetical protein